MTLIEQLVTSFIAAAGFGIIFNVPKESLVKCGFVGMVGWITYIVLWNNGMDMILATVIASFLVAVISRIFARAYKTPIIIFIVAGIIPLVPGGLAYDAMRNFVENNYNAAINIAAKAFLISGSIAIGIVFSEVVSQIIDKISLKNKRRMV
jgi:uncharacterized membrane protein YjjB (DUF3815 family)